MIMKNGKEMVEKESGNKEGAFIVHYPTKSDTDTDLILQMCTQRVIANLANL